MWDERTGEGFGRRFVGGDGGRKGGPQILHCVDEERIGHHVLLKLLQNRGGGDPFGTAPMHPRLPPTSTISNLLRVGLGHHLRLTGGFLKGVQIICCIFCTFHFFKNVFVVPVSVGNPVPLPFHTQTCHMGLPFFVQPNVRNIHVRLFFFIEWQVLAVPPRTSSSPPSTTGSGLVL